MDRARRLQGLWSWLPVFRAVAETEHLPTAAARLFVTPPAVSRSIRLLEEDLGVRLFDRVGRRLRLNSAGAELLRAVREAMRRLDDAVQVVTERRLAGPLRVAAPMPFLSLLVLPAVEELQAAWPDLEPHLVSVGPRAANASLLNGQLDLALLDDPVPHRDLRVERLAPIRYGLYCGPTHPLRDAEAPTLEDVARYPFAGPPDGNDHWPPGLVRRTTLTLGHLYLGVEACLAGRHLAVLPDLVARHHPAGAALHRVPLEPFGDTALYAVRRPPLTEATADEQLLAAIRRRLEALEGPAA